MSARKLRSLIAVGAVLLLAAACGGRGRYNPDILHSGRGTMALPTVPQECGAGSSFGTIGEGTVVVLRHHRPVEGDRNWIAGMTRYIGRSTRVTARAGRDPAGCAVVHVASDGGHHFWRVRDLVVPGRGLGPGGGDAVPQSCDQDEETAYYGLVAPGARVVLWRHRRFDGESNWVEDMSEHVGEEAQVTRLAGVDNTGCPVVNVDSDTGEWVWRVRDLTLVETGLPQICGPGDAGRDRGPLAVGSTVRLGRHRPVRGDAGWQHSMEQYVGRTARVTSLGPPDDQGCPVVHVDADQGARSWRVRDLSLLDEVRGGRAVATAAPPSGGGGGPPRGTTTGIPETCGMPFGSEDYGSVREGSRIVLGRHRPVDGDDNWSAEMGEYVGRTATVTRLSGSDAAGCPGVRVDVDGGEWFWRVRDARSAP